MVETSPFELLQFVQLACDGHFLANSSCIGSHLGKERFEGWRFNSVVSMPFGEDLGTLGALEWILSTFFWFAAANPCSCRSCSHLSWYWKLRTGPMLKESLSGFVGVCIPPMKRQQNTRSRLDGTVSNLDGVRMFSCKTNPVNLWGWGRFNLHLKSLAEKGVMAWALKRSCWL